MSLYKQPKSPYWWVSISSPNGGRVRESSGSADKREAQKYHDTLKAKLWNSPQRRGTTWDAACIKWLKEKPRSLSDKYLIRSIGSVRELEPGAFKHVLDGRKPGTYNKYRAIILAICNLSEIPLKLPKKETPEGRLIFLTAEQWENLYYFLPDHLKPICAFAIATGLRQANVVSLEWCQVDMSRKTVWFHADQMKAKKAIGIPLGKSAMDVLKGLDQSGKHVFLYRGKPIQKPKIGFQNACVKAGLGEWSHLIENGKRVKRYSGFTFHGLRHTWASWSIMAGTPIEVLKDLGGWADLQMVMRYAHLSPEHLRGYADNAKPYKPSKRKAA